MICGHCGHENDDETRCGHCGRRLDEARYRSASPGTLQRNAGGAMSSAPWRGELRRRLDAYRTRRDAAASQAARAASSASSTDDPNVVSIDRGADFPRPTPAAERLGLADEMKWREQQRNAAAFTANDSTTSAAPAPTPAAHDVSEPRPFLPSLEGGPPRHDEPVAADPALAQSRALPRELRCAATLAPLQIRFLAGVLDAAVLIVSLGVFWGVFHELGGAISADREGARAVGFTAFLVTGFYWAFHVGYFGTTPGMTWVGLRLLNFHGRRANARQRAVRALGLLFSTTTLGIGFAWAFLDDEELTWHDRMSKTFLSRDGAIGFRSRAVEARPRHSSQPTAAGRPPKPASV